MSRSLAPSGGQRAARLRCLSGDAIIARGTNARFLNVSDTATLAFPIAIGNDYGRIAIAALAQLDAVRHDLAGDAAAFPRAAASMERPDAVAAPTD